MAHITKTICDGIAGGGRNRVIGASFTRVGRGIFISVRRAFDARSTIIARVSVVAHTVCYGGTFGRGIAVVGAV